MLDENLKKLMEMKGMSQIDLSRKSGIHPSLLNRILKGKEHTPNMTTIQRLAEGLDVSIAALTGEEDMNTTILKALEKAQPKEILEFLSKPENSGYVALMVWGKDEGLSEDEIKNILTLYKQIKNKEQGSSSTT